MTEEDLDIIDGYIERVAQFQAELERYKAGTLQVVRDSNKLQLEASAKIRKLQAENKILTERNKQLQSLSDSVTKLRKSVETVLGGG